MQSYYVFNIIVSRKPAHMSCFGERSEIRGCRGEEAQMRQQRPNEAATFFFF